MTGVSAEKVILLVEDEPMLRMVIAETLEDSGYQVIEAADGCSALDLIEQGRKFDLLISDVKMPGLSGYGLVEAALARAPKIKAVLMTGYASEAMPLSIRDASIPVLQKPFNFEALLTLVDRLVPADAPSSSSSCAGSLNPQN